MFLSDDEASMLLEITEEYGCNNSDAVRMLIRKEIASWRDPELALAVSRTRGAPAPSAWGSARSTAWPIGWPSDLRRRPPTEAELMAQGARRKPDEPNPSPKARKAAGASKVANTKRAKGAKASQRTKVAKARS